MKNSFVRVMVSVKMPSNSNIEFCFSVSEIQAPGELWLEDSFYLFKEGCKLPEGTHFEAECTYPKLYTHVHFPRIHIHKSKKEHVTDSWFVCYPFQIRTIEDMKQLLRVWSAGTAYTMIFGEMFDRVFEVKNPLEKNEEFFEKLKDLGIEILKTDWQ